MYASLCSCASNEIMSCSKYRDMSVQCTLIACVCHSATSCQIETVLSQCLDMSSIFQWMFCSQLLRDCHCQTLHARVCVHLTALKWIFCQTFSTPRMQTFFHNWIFNSNETNLNSFFHSYDDRTRAESTKWRYWTDNFMRKMKKKKQCNISGCWAFELEHFSFYFFFDKSRFV